MKRLIIIIFAICAATLIFFFFNRSTIQPDNGISVTRARTVIPATDSSSPERNTEQNIYAEDTTLISLIPLRSDETVINTLSIDFDGDGYDDQINAVKTISSPYITLLVGLYNPYRGQYERSAEIITEIMQARTFSYTCMDIIGDHSNALIYSGLAENSDSIMKIYIPQNQKGQFSVKRIGNFRSDGTIFIQQLDRYDSYESQQSTGASYPVWVYSTDASRGGNTLDQLQTMYSWDPGQQLFVKSSETRVTETKVTAQELSRIQDGTVETFAAFLNGLWYKTNNTDDGIRYLFFDFQEKEIIFQTADTQEVYSWVTSTLRRNGMYISAVNSSVGNLTRRIDISLTGIDKIKITTQDDVLMLIKETSLWDGEYRKQTNAVAALQKTTVTDTDTIISLLENQNTWLLPDSTPVVFEDGHFTVQNYTGRTAFSRCDNRDILQLEQLDGTPFSGHENYLPVIEYSEDTTTVKALQLIPVNLSPTSVLPAGQSVIVLEPDLQTDETGTPQ